MVPKDKEGQTPSLQPELPAGADFSERNCSQRGTEVWNKSKALRNPHLTEIFPSPASISRVTRCTHPINRTSFPQEDFWNLRIWPEFPISTCEINIQLNPKPTTQELTTPLQTLFLWGCPGSTLLLAGFGVMSRDYSLDCTA